MTADPSGRTDAELLGATAGGDEEAFLEIYRRYQGRVYRFVFRMTGSPEAARDVMHSCFASLLEAPRRYQPHRADLATYLCAAARNQSLRHTRRRSREPAISASVDMHASRGPSPLDVLLADERSRIVREAVLALAPLHREVLILAEYEELHLAEIAEIVGAKVGAVKVRLHRARQRLRRALEGYMSRSPVTTQART